MTGVRVSEHFGIVVRKAALDEHHVSMHSLFQVMETERPFDEDADLVSFGPHFGGEAAGEFIGRLEALGLIYGQDFIDFADSLPEWCHLYMALGS